MVLYHILQSTSSIFRNPASKSRRRACISSAIYCGISLAPRAPYIIKALALHITDAKHRISSRHCRVYHQRKALYIITPLACIKPRIFAMRIFSRLAAVQRANVALRRECDPVSSLLALRCVGLCTARKPASAAE